MKDTTVREHQQHMDGQDPAVPGHAAADSAEEHRGPYPYDGARGTPEAFGTSPDPRSSEPASERSLVTSPSRPHRLSSTVWTAGAALAVAAVVWLAPTLLEARSSPPAALPGAMPGTAGMVRYVGSLGGALGAPVAVAAGPFGDVYVADADAEGGVVKRFGQDGALLQTIGATSDERRATGETSDKRRATGDGRPAADDGGPAASGESQATGAQPFDGAQGTPGAAVPHGERRATGDGVLLRPTSVAVGPTGRVFVADVASGRISVFDENGGFSGYFGEGPDGSRPFARAGYLLHRGGLLYVTDVERHAVAALRPDGSLDRTIGRGKGSEPGQLLYPGAVWVDAEALVYVADANNHRIEVFNGKGEFLRTIFHDSFDLPRGVVEDAEGRLHIVNTLGHTVTVVSKEGRFLFTYGYSSEEWNGFGFPSGIAITGDRVYVADRANGRVQVFAVTGAAR